MAERESVKQLIHFGKESPAGTTAPVTNRAMGFSVNPTPNGDFKAWRPQGNKSNQLQMLMREWSTSGVSGIPNYVEMGYQLASVIGVPVSSGGVAGSRNVHVFRYDNRYEQAVQTYTFEYGTPDSYAHRVSNAFFDAWGVDFSRSEANMTGNMIARAIESGITMTTGAAEAQDITPTGGPTGGTFKLRFKGKDTAAITFNATLATLATNIQTALNAISTIGASGVVATVVGSAVRVTFSGTALVGQQQPLLVLSDNSLTGGTTPSLTIANFAQGGFVEDDLIPILPGQVSIYMADTYAGLVAGKLTRARTAGFNITNRAAPYWVMDAAQSSFLKTIETPIDVKLSLQLQANSNGMGLLDTGRNGAGKFIRIEAVGPLISGSDYHKFTLDAFMKVSAFGNLEDQEGVYQTNYELSLAEDISWGHSLLITLENGKAAY